jgi:plastocyanin
MKNFIIILVTISALGVGLYLHKSGESDAKIKPQVKFFHQSQILPTDVVVKVTKNGFEPPKVNIKKGGRVVWLNETSAYVWPASDPHPTHEIYGGFDPEEPFQIDEVWAFTFNKAGSWKYHDHLNPGNTGVIDVLDN